jgi:hypothetical protein
VGDIQEPAADRSLSADVLGKGLVKCFGGSAIAAISPRATCFRAAQRAKGFSRMIVFGGPMMLRSNVRIGLVVAMAAASILVEDLLRKAWVAAQKRLDPAVISRFAASRCCSASE